MKKKACFVVLMILLALQFPSCFKLDRSVSQPEGMLLVVPTMVVLLTNTETNMATQEDIFQLHKQIAAWKEFFVREVGQYIELELHFVQIDDYVGLEDITKMGSGGYHLLATDASTLLRRAGINPRGFSLVVAFWAWRPRSGVYKAYGGAAEGPPSYSLDGAGYHSQAVFDGPYEYISRVSIHESLHNLDGMFDLVGIERFWHADQMAALMPELLAEKPGAFLPYRTDSEMLELAEKEKKGQYSFSWEEQLVFYRHMLARMEPWEWEALELGYRRDYRDVKRMSENVYVEPLYKTMSLPAGVPAYVPVLVRNSNGSAVDNARVYLAEQRLNYETYIHTGQSSVVFENAYYGGWTDPELEGTVRIAVENVFGSDGQALSSTVVLRRR